MSHLDNLLNVSDYSHIADKQLLEKIDMYRKKINYYSFKINQLSGGDNIMFAKIENCECSGMSKKAYLKKCIPQYNVVESNVNIHFVENNTQYTLNYAGDGPNYILDTKEGILKQTKSKTQSDMFFNRFDANITDYMFNFNGDNVPGYYLMLNYAEVFGVYGLLYNNDIFRTSNNEFIGMSLTPNIFTLFVTLHKYIELVDIFASVFKKINDNDTIRDKKLRARDINYFITTSINDLLEENKNYVVKLWNLYEYKKTNATKTRDGQNIEENETNCKFNDDQTFDKIKQSCSMSLYNIAINLTQLSSTIHMSNYKYMFLLSMIGYRLTNSTINGGWCFSIKKTLEQLMGRQVTTNKINTYDLFSKRLLLYETSTVQYNGATFANCVENTFFQFIKVIFWNEILLEYDLKLIQILIKPEYYAKILSMFENIDNERTQKMLNEWEEFISQLPGPFEKINTNEFNATVENLISFVVSLFNNNQDRNSNHVDILNGVFGKFGFVFTINESNINIATKLNKYTMILHRNGHGQFTNVCSDTIIMTFKNTVLKDTKKFEKYCDLYDVDKNNKVEILQEVDVASSGANDHDLGSIGIKHKEHMMFIFMKIYYEHPTKLKIVAEKNLFCWTLYHIFLTTNDYLGKQQPLCDLFERFEKKIPSVLHGILFDTRISFREIPETIGTFMRLLCDNKLLPLFIKYKLIVMGADRALDGRLYGLVKLIDVNPYIENETMFDVALDFTRNTVPLFTPKIINCPTVDDKTRDKYMELFPNGVFVYNNNIKLIYKMISKCELYLPTRTGPREFFHFYLPMFDNKENTRYWGSIYEGYTLWEYYMYWWLTYYVEYPNIKQQADKIRQYNDPYNYSYFANNQATTSILGSMLYIFEKNPDVVKDWSIITHTTNIIYRCLKIILAFNPDVISRIVTYDAVKNYDVKIWDHIDEADMRKIIWTDIITHNDVLKILKQSKHSYMF